MVAALALTALAFLQTPYPPGITVPESWKVNYWASPRYGGGAVTSPQGLEIGFPDYTPTGNVALVQYEMYSKTYYFSTVVERVLIHAAIAPDGLLAVSYPDDLARKYKANPYPFDYWSHPKGARQIAQAILIPLTRLSNHPAREGDKSVLQFMEMASAGSPFSLLAAVYQRGSVERTRTGLKLGSAAATLSEPPKAKPKWTESIVLQESKLEISETDRGNIWVIFSRPGKAPVVMLASDREAPSIVLATLAAITYSRGGDG